MVVPTGFPCPVRDYSVGRRLPPRVRVRERLFLYPVRTVPKLDHRTCQPTRGAGGTLRVRGRLLRSRVAVHSGTRDSAGPQGSDGSTRSYDQRAQDRSNPALQRYRCPGPPLLQDPVYGSPYVPSQPPSPGPGPQEVLDPYYTDAAPVLGVPIGAPEALGPLMGTASTKHARLMNLVDKMAKTGHPHAALRLLQVCGVRRYQHFLRGLPPDQSLEPLAMGDMLVRDSLLQLLRMTEAEHAELATRDVMARASLPTRMGGLNLPKMSDEAELAHVSAFAAAAEDLHSRLASMAGNRAAERVAGCLAEVPEETAWGLALREARRSVTPLLSLDPESVATLRDAAPEGPPTFRCGVRLNRARAPARFRERRPEYRDEYTDIASIRVPSCDAMSFRRVKGLQAKLSRARRAREYLYLMEDLIDSGHKRETARMLSSSGGGVAFTVSDDTLTHDLDSDEYIRHRASPRPRLPSGPSLPVAFRCQSCLQTQSMVAATAANCPAMAMADHLPRCPADANPSEMHDEVRDCLANLLVTETSINPRDIVTEKTNLIRDTCLAASAHRTSSSTTSTAGGSTCSWMSLSSPSSRTPP